MRESLDIANKSANAAQKSADSLLPSLRPWLSCRAEIAGFLAYNSGGNALFELKFTIKNRGHAPASNVRLASSVALVSPQHGHSIGRLQEAANLNRGLPIGFALALPGGVPINSEVGRMLFPNETRIEHHRSHVKRSEIEKACEDIEPNMNFWRELCALVTYAYPLAIVRADTGFVYRIERQDGVFELDEAVPMEEMRINDEVPWGGVAT